LRAELAAVGAEVGAAAEAAEVELEVLYLELPP
jgi:hypothetical protein